MNKAVSINIDMRMRCHKATGKHRGDKYWVAEIEKLLAKYTEAQIMEAFDHMLSDPANHREFLQYGIKHFAYKIEKYRGEIATLRAFAELNKPDAPADYDEIARTCPPKLLARVLAAAGCSPERASELLQSRRQESPSETPA